MTAFWKIGLVYLAVLVAAFLICTLYTPALLGG